MNPWAGEVVVVIEGAAHRCRLTLGALAELEAKLEGGSLIELVERFETGTMRAKDILAVLIAGLRGGGWSGELRDLAQAEIEGGALGVARAAAQLLARAFALPSAGPI